MKANHSQEFLDLVNEINEERDENRRVPKATRYNDKTFGVIASLSLSSVCSHAREFPCGPIRRRKNAYTNE